MSAAENAPTATLNAKDASAAPAGRLTTHPHHDGRPLPGLR
ncbi:hypothetical protein F4561_001268 [Lipingzhangella halophila]|uniref:Uncharacterized protein n=1 Tax=Lipingzhangella halophila TaxID=1783352 RepID=A0A7W7W1L3_9ACTN|nr:hypothetical protein [Lipingzhangella halophila]